MSESEQMGRCFSEVYECRGSPSTLKIADAIDRLAADVAAIKEAACGRSGWPVGWLIEVDRLNHRRQEAINLADEARAEVARMQADGNQAPDDLGFLRDAHGLSERCKELASRIVVQEIERRAERAMAELEQQPPAAPQPAAPPAGWLTEEERRLIEGIMESASAFPPTMHYHSGFSVRDALRVMESILARAGSPPVVEVPVMGTPDSTTTREKQIALAYRAAIDKAGVKWKEVGRE